MDKRLAVINSWVEESPWRGLIASLFFLSVFYWPLVFFVEEFSLGVKVTSWVGLMIVMSPLPWLLPKNGEATDEHCLLPENAMFTMYRDENGIYIIRSDSRPHLVRCGGTPDEVVQKMAEAMGTDK